MIGVNFKPEVNQRSRDIYKARLNQYTMQSAAAMRRAMESNEIGGNNSFDKHNNSSD